MDMNQYLEIFIEESREHLQHLNQSLLQLEKNPQDEAMLNEIFRAAHTLKGMSGTMGFNKMSTLTHDMENVLQLLRSEEIKVNTELIDLLFKCLDALEFYVNSIIESGTEGNKEYSDIIDQLNSVIRNNQEKPANEAQVGKEEKLPEDFSVHTTRNFKINEYEQNIINKAYNENYKAYKITVVLGEGCVLKSARAFLIFQTIEKYSEIIKSYPAVEDIEDERFESEFTVVVISRESEETFIRELNSISEVKEVILSNLYPNNEASNDEHDSTGNETEENGDMDKTMDELAVGTATKKTKTGKTVRVEIARLDVLLNLVSELIIQKTRLGEIQMAERSQTFNETLEYLERITTNLHDAVMKVRMVPVETVFNRFPRMIRDISKELGKEVNLVMSGEETELDRTVIDEIGDPLIHLLRNSVDHGIEPVEMRKKLGKPSKGTVNLRAYQDGNSVVIEVQDDGQGIDLESVKKKAIEKGLINKEVINNMSTKDIIDFLFLPSFSTANKVTDISGRGVGLDVVKTKIEALGGVIEVETGKGKGSRFIIRLPLTLAIIQALLVMIGNEKYAIQLSAIHQIIKIAPEEIKMVQKQEVILLRNTVIPIVRLDEILEVPREEKTEKKQLTVVIVKKGDKLSGFLVDSIIGQQEIVQKSLGKLLSGIKTITSATILGDGNVALILDVNSIA
ncbi:MAG: chemotaxis protein CheW [Acetivibrionales bacterium]|jgi:two-component system chemotaxis sensor kinase CheA